MKSAAKVLKRSSHAPGAGHNRTDQAVVFLTHRENARILRHFQRLQQETHGLLSTYFCVHASAPTTAKSNSPMEFRVGVEDGIRTLPRRFRQMKEQNLTYNRGFPDLAYMPALLDARLEPYAYIWLVEYDVDWTGHWAHFFERTMGSTADLLGTTIFPRSQSKNWYHWNWFSTPAEVESKCQTRSFLPIVRFSRRLLDLYVGAMETGLWRGHTEALYPTIALHHGLLIEDLGSQGPFCPERWRKKNYVNTPMDWSLSPGTFVSAPVLHNAYFHEMPVGYERPNFLYHPVKPDD